MLRQTYTLGTIQLSSGQGQDISLKITNLLFSTAVFFVCSADLCKILWLDLFENSAVLGITHLSPHFSSVKLDFVLRWNSRLEENLPPPGLMMGERPQAVCAIVSRWRIVAGSGGDAGYTKGEIFTNQHRYFFLSWQDCTLSEIFSILLDLIHYKMVGFFSKKQLKNTFIYN